MDSMNSQGRFSPKYTKQFSPLPEMEMFYGLTAAEGMRPLFKIGHIITTEKVSENMRGKKYRISIYVTCPITRD